ncbi:MAG: hypothetical protein CL840_16590 [Crocinitomicaceae bacterium]|nr:hypothetical protein [Crocinitomicaceae bacterium]|tara:strand:- start:8834 stop:9595 length:762 start_codon:yes stop_codon:yes gene_type:complete
MNKGDNNYVKIRAFRAIDEPEMCDKFILGHSRVLTSVGVDQVSSSSHDWKYNPASFVILCESQDEEKVFGGVRVHALGGNQELPIEEATKEMDPTISSHINKYASIGTGEMCGLWNSMEVAGMGIGAVYLIRSAVAVLEQLKLGSLWALCSPFSARIARNYSFLKYDKVGNGGTFYYPKIDLLATVCFVEDSYRLESGKESELVRIFDLRKNPVQTVDEVNRGMRINIEYDLKLKNIDTSVYFRNKDLNEERL